MAPSHILSGSSTPFWAQSYHPTWHHCHLQLPVKKHNYTSVLIYVIEFPRVCFMEFTVGKGFTVGKEFMVQWKKSKRSSPNEVRASQGGSSEAASGNVL